MPADELVDPVAYSAWVMPLGLVLMAAVVAWVVWVVRSERLVARPTKQEPAPPRPGPPVPGGPRDRWASIRPVYLERVDEVERRYRAGELDPRGLHLELSAVVREFATVRTGEDVRRMTLAEIRRLSGTKRLAKLIDSYYRPAFSARGARGSDVRRAVDGARTVIRRW